MRKKILIVEDDPTLSDVLASYLRDAGYDCYILDDGMLVEQWFATNQPDMVMLDVVLPGINGIELCGRIRSLSKVPILMVTGQTEEIDRLRGLDKGADDYICKPFRPREVVARVGAIFRRVEPGFGSDRPTRVAQLDSDNASFFLDVKRHKLYVQDRDISLTTVQCNVLSLLMRNEGKIVSRDDIIGDIYPDNRVVSSRTIDSHIRELRKHMKKVLPDSEVIFSVYGAGYKFEMPLF